MGAGEQRKEGHEQREAAQAHCEAHHGAHGQAEAAVHGVVEHRLDAQHRDAGQEVGNVELQEHFWPVVPAELGQQRRNRRPCQLVGHLCGMANVVCGPRLDGRRRKTAISSLTDIKKKQNSVA